jgi:hypothetical protein
VVVALTDYRLEMLDDLRGMTMPEGVKMGDQLMTSSLEDKWPVSTGTVAYEETVGDHPNLTSWGEKFFSLTTKEYSAGAIASAAALRTTEWAAHGWGQMPKENAEALMYLFESLLAATLEAGGSTASWMKASDYVFDTNKPCDPANPGGANVFDNLYPGTALSVANIAAARTNFRNIKNAAGRKRGLKLTHIICGPDKEDELLTYLKDPAIVVAYGNGATESATMVTNKIATHYPDITPIVLPLLDDSGVWYPVASRNGKMPWITLMKLFSRNMATPGMPTQGIQAADGLEWFMLDEQSDHYKVGSKLGPAGTVAQWSKGRTGCAITREWEIFRCEP